MMRIIKYILYGVIIVNLLTLSTYCQQDLPFPYNSIEVLPFNPHNWFTSVNAAALENLIRTRPIKTVVELGSWMGASARYMANLLPEDGKVYAIDNWRGSIDQDSLDTEKKAFDLDKLYRQFLSNIIHAQLTDKIVPIRMDTVEAARTFLKLKPDLVYVDASHDEKSVYEDIKAWWPYVCNGGIMCGDDWDYHGVRAGVHKFARENNLQVYGHASFWMFISNNKN